MRKLLLTFYFSCLTVITVVLFGSLGYATHLVHLLRRRDDQGYAAHRIASWWARTFCRLMPGWSINIRGLENLQSAPSPVVLIANHESISDILLLYHLPIQFRWLSKSTVFRYPLIGHTMKWAGYIPVERGNKASQQAALATAQERLKQGISIFLFPEGTRSESGELLPFRSGAFRLSALSQAAILPIAMHGSAHLLPKGHIAPGRFATQMLILPAVHKKPTESVEEFTERVRRQLVVAHEQVKIFARESNNDARQPAFESKPSTATRTP